MHELSIAIELIKIAEKAASDNNASRISEIEIDIGDDSGVDTQSLSTAIQAVASGTIAKQSKITINRIEAIAQCTSCGHQFSGFKYPQCPICQSHFVKIVQGKELRIKSIVIE